MVDTTEDQRTLWVGNLDEKVTEELLYELFLQTGPIEKLILPKEGEKGEEKHMGQAYILFKHADSVKYASQVLDGTSLFSQKLSMKARSLPMQYKKPAPQVPGSFQHSNRGGRFDRFDNSSLRGGFSFNKSNTWHGQNNSFVPKGRGGHRSRGGYNNYNQGGNYYNQGGSGYNNYQNQQSNSYPGSSGDDNGSGNSLASYNTGGEDKRQRLLQQQNLTLAAHRQIQQGVMSMASQVYSTQQQLQQQAQQWANSASGNNQSGMYQSYSTQYSGWYQTQ